MQFFLISTVIYFSIKTCRCFENVALNKPAFSNDVFSPNYSAQNAVDGKISQVNARPHLCAISKEGNPYWYVDLREVCSIHSVKIFYRRDTSPGIYRRRFAGFSLYISNTNNSKEGHLCYKNNATEPLPNLIFNKTCITHGRYVKYYNNRRSNTFPPAATGTDAWAELCEVQVFGCSGSTKYGQNCSLKCSNICNKNWCNIVTGKCSRCAYGFTGNNCEKQSIYENLSQGKQAYLSSLLTKGVTTADKSVDGNLNRTWNYVAATAFNENGATAEWRVDLGGKRSIHNIVLFFRDDGLNTETSTLKFRQWYSDFTIYITNNTNDIRSGIQCNVNSSFPPFVYNIVCMHIGRYVRISNQHDGKLIEFAEVQVFGCKSPHSYGEACNMSCPSKCLNGWCNIVNGNCFECANGYGGENCNVSCLSNTSGKTCEVQCNGNCKDDRCLYENNVCASGCKREYFGNKCNKKCIGHCKNRYCNQKFGNCDNGCFPGFFGKPVCLHTCNGNCKNNETCNETTGFCDHGCIFGYFGSNCSSQCQSHCKNNTNCNQNTGLCDKGCAEGYYSPPNCTKQCSGHCIGNSSCNSTSGFCDNGCEKGRKGDKCLEGCGFKKYGYNCEEDCGNCRNNHTCDTVSGVCESGCEKGLQPPYCNETCVNGTYGLDCNSSCSKHCKDNEACNKMTGFCNTCNPGWKAERCFKKCSNGTYGQGCALKCSTNCKEGPFCNHVNGNCDQGCRDGYFGDTCTDKCSKNCYNITLCSKTNGVCEADCTSVWKGKACGEAMPYHNNSSPDLQIAIGVSVPVVLIVIIIIILVRIMSRRRKQQQRTKEEKEDSIKRTSSNGNSKTDKRNKYLDTNPYMNETEFQSSTSSIDQTYYNVEPNSSTKKNSILIENLNNVIQRMLHNKNTGFVKEYKELPYGELHTCDEGKKPENVPKNRFKTTFPYDHSRIILETSPQQKSDYVNANYIKNVQGEKVYIAAQGPKANTVIDFWKMLWQENVRKIVMATNLKEGIKTKCEKYWPDAGEKMSKGSLVIRLDKEKKYANYIIRILKISDKSANNERIIHQFHFTRWPDHGVPDILSLVVFHRHVMRVKSTTDNKVILVHCSAGIGRTGTFIALDALYQQGEETNCVNIFEYVKSMREDRMSMIQTEDQYITVYLALRESFRGKSQVIWKDKFVLNVEEELKNDRPANARLIKTSYNELESLKPSYSAADFKDGRENIEANLNKQVLPVDKFRCNLFSYSKSRGNYYNAVILESYMSKDELISAQFPLPSFEEDFLRLIEDFESRIVISVNPLSQIESSNKWMPVNKDPLKVGEFTVTLQSSSSCTKHVKETNVWIQKQGSERFQVKIFEPLSWNTSESLPNNSQIALDLAEQAQSKTSPDHDNRVICLSQDGVTGCGVIFTLYNALQQLQLDSEVDIFTIVRILQIRRPEVIQSMEEYQFCFKAVADYLKSAQTSQESHHNDNIYANC